MLDGAQAGTIRAGQFVTIPIAPGPHLVVLRIDWCGSPEISFEAQPGEHPTFECGSILTGLRIFLGVFFRPPFVTQSQATRPKVFLPIAVTANGVAMLLLLVVYIGIIRQVKIEERDWDFGDGLDFFGFAMPALGICLVINGCWLFKAVLDIRRRRGYRSLMALAVIALAWVLLYFGSYGIS